MNSLYLSATFLKSKIMTIFKKIIKTKQIFLKMPKGPCARMSAGGFGHYSPAGDGMIVRCVWMANCLMGERHEL